MKTRQQDTLKRLCEALLRADSEAAHEEYETDSEFRAEVDRGVNSLLERYGKEIAATGEVACDIRKPDGCRNLAEIENLRDYLRGLINIPEDVAYEIAEFSELTVNDCRKAAEKAPVAAMGVTDGENFQLPLAPYFRDMLSLAEEVTKIWSGATLSFQRLTNGLRLLLEGEPDGWALAVSVGGHSGITLNEASSAEIVPCDTGEIEQLRIGLVPFRGAKP